ncbi:hypothetical protein U1Q18_044363 [Sarracenia purpurea var. burkii]
MNTIILYATAVIFIGTANLPSSLAAPQKLVDLDSQTRAQIYSPEQYALPSITNLMPSFLQNLLPSDKNGYPNAVLPLLYTPQIVNLLSKDIFSFADHMVTLLNTVLQIPPNIDIQDHIARLQKLMRNGQIPKEQIPFAKALVSLLRDQPVLRALQESLSELQRSTSFNLSTSNQGLNNPKLKTDFNLPSTLITPSIKSSFGISSVPDDDFIGTPSTGNAKDDNPFIMA